MVCFLGQPLDDYFSILSQRDYEEFKVRINALVAKAQKTPEEGWTMSDGLPWPGNNPRDHPGMIQVYPFFLDVIKTQCDRHNQLPDSCISVLNF